MLFFFLQNREAKASAALLPFQPTTYILQPSTFLSTISRESHMFTQAVISKPTPKKNKNPKSNFSIKTSIIAQKLHGLHSLTPSKLGAYYFLSLYSNVFKWVMFRSTRHRQQSIYDAESDTLVSNASNVIFLFFSSFSEDITLHSPPSSRRLWKPAVKALTSQYNPTSTLDLVACCEFLSGAKMLSF